MDTMEKLTLPRERTADFELQKILQFHAFHFQGHANFAWAVRDDLKFR